MKKNITIFDMKKISSNLMMNMSDDEIEIIKEEIKKSVDDLSHLAVFHSEKYNLLNVQPLDFPEIQTSNGFREDIIKDFKNKESLLKHPKEVIKNLIKV
ncbi:hypothetical protein [Malacoplasma muris]|uniref:hypothetical protein n=1 Tax=Malacoplasma muris TaxID=2119 RepID=UPI00398EC47B